MPPNTIAGLLDQAAARYPQKDAVWIGDHRITFAELVAQSDQLARALLHSGVVKGSRLAVWMGNCIEWLVTFHAASRIGAVLVPLSTRFKAEEAHYILDQAQVGCLVMNDAFAGIDFVQLFDEVAPDFRRDGASSRLPHLRSAICVGRRGTTYPGFVDYASLLEQGRGLSDDALGQSRAALQGEDAFLIQYTSGTTGFPKGAVLTHGNFTHTAYEVGLRQQLSPDDRFFSPAPYFHVSGTMHALTAPLAFGCTVYSLERYDAEDVLSTLARHQCTVYHGFNFFKDYFARQAEFAGRYDPSVLQRVWTTGTLVDLSKIAALGIRVCSLYGLSETTGCATICSADDEPESRLQSVGKPLPGVEICIQDRQGNGATLPAGEEGEVCIRGANLMSGYFGKPQETQASFDKQGWFHTGDLGCMDQAGNLRFLGRIKDIIRVGGENFSPLEVENLLRRHEKVAEACVVGVPDERLGEVGMAFIKLRAGCVMDGAEVVAYCRHNISSFKVPRHVQFVEEFPMTGNNKIRRVEVKNLAKGVVRA